MGAVEYKEFTFGEFIDAIEENGLPQTFGSFFRNKLQDGLSLNPRGIIWSACAVGQGDINLGIRPDGWLGDWDGDVQFVREQIYELNDIQRLSLPEIAQKVRDRYPTVLSTKIKAPVKTYKVVKENK